MIERELSLTDNFTKELTNLILSNELEVGNKLPSIRDLSNKYHISRSVVAKGLKKLQLDGLLEQDQSNHYIVKAINRFERIETMLYYLNFDNYEITKKEGLAILRVKSALDQLAIDSIEELKEADYLRLKAILNPKFSKNVKDYPLRLATEYERFMREFYLLADNVILPLFLKSFYNVTLRMIEDYCKITNADDMFRATKEMLDALYLGNKDLAKAKMKERFFYNKY